MSVLVLWILALAQEDPARKALDDFRRTIAKAKSVEEKAGAIGALAATGLDDPSFVAPVARFLGPVPADLHFTLPQAAIEFLARLRGNRGASEALLQALQTFRKNPALARRVVAALGRVGHESAVQVLEERLRGPEGDLALRAVSQMPAATALEVLFRELQRTTQAGEGADRVLKAIQTISGEGYVTAPEWQIWWKRQGPVLRGRPKEKRAAPAGLPPPPIVELAFNETAANTGLSSGAVPEGALAARPSWIGIVPPGGGSRALDWGASPAPGCAVDLAGTAAHLRNLKSFTIAGWINVRSDQENAGGNRLVHWLLPRGDGVDLAWRGDGGLQLGVNQPADASPARSPSALFPAAPPKAADEALGRNWRFFAATYDSTLPSGQVRFYSGESADALALRGAADYARGPVGPKVAPALAVGNVAAAARSPGQERPFRGILDEVRILGSTVDGAGALTLPQLTALIK